MKRKLLAAGRIRKLHDDAEDFIVQCIEDKGFSAAHGRRHDSVVYSGMRVKYDNLLYLVDQFQESNDKEHIKSISTIQLLSKPKNKRSKQAKQHNGRALFCTQKPQKSGCQENENTHHQRCHVKLVREDMFTTSNENASKSLLISMDDKAHLKPGTNIGAIGA